ncbi:MAG TPA: type IV toxin-antitoxin system AbiEi family antitoxin domain-containing protein [Solirubrobacteraceae bacterium]|nr:type IV toxin-antitoxin system AbiEi family antitoxin domain-containing protein [Solirubrobacteraceae bacterium]
MDLAHRIAEVARRQGGHVTTAQLHTLGLSHRAIEHRVARGALIRVHQGVYAVGHLPTTPQERAHGALLAVGPRSALGGFVALALWRADRDWPTEMELIAALDRRPAGLRVRRSASLLQRDIRTVRGLRVTSPARTALDLAPRVSEHELTRLVNDLRHRTGLGVRELRDVTRRNPRHRGHRALVRLIGEAQREPTRSELENAFLRLCRRHGLPTPRINVHVGGERVDAHFPEHRLIVELDGREVTHAEDWRPAFERDRARVVDIMLRTGLPTIRFTWDQVTRRHEATAAKLEGILAARLAERRSP